MASVTLLWFACSNPDCNYVPDMPKKEKVKFWREGQSIQREARRRIFMSYAEGHYKRLNDDKTIIFSCKYGELCMYDSSENPRKVHDYYNPIDNAEMCNVCKARIQNDGALYQ